MLIVWRLEPGKDSVPAFLVTGRGKVLILDGADVAALRSAGVKEAKLTAALVDAIPVAG